ncbi:hypothetical protein G4G28_03490 [Massilia sp. Dwa41.01b]|uniref:surface-adhesin E family protein n=1 Tax=unclassified Massilia TaxID=2609279 RepID=UPI0016011784|nr:MULTISPECIES: surface-adhesin E family protein [unclassified Massilia]QNA87764.1 hypothetical protein G4G28_03490 [Massilia sp. Dwa41.01b]QNA98668.1 hypothetical protein G4G31_07215 [Massilia sp. Se16.2.3]
MKNLLLPALLALCASLANASETVTIGGVKTLKYSESEVREYVRKMNSLKTDMSVDEVLAIMGRPYREQPVSSTQRIFVYPLSIIVSFYQNRQTGKWQVTAPALYTNPYCQRMDGTPQTGALGQDASEYPNVNCIPKPGSKPQAEEAPKPVVKRIAMSSLPKPEWKLLNSFAGNKWTSASKTYYDTHPVKNGNNVMVRQMMSYPVDQGAGYATYRFRSQIYLLLVSCKAKDEESVFIKGTESYSGEMGTGNRVNVFDNTPSESSKESWTSDDNGLKKIVCK